MCLLRTFIRKGFCPNLLRNGRNIILIELQSLNIRFLSSNNYFNCNEFDLAKQYNIKFTQNYFPYKLLNISNFGYIGNIPNFNFFTSSLDDFETLESKRQYYINRCSNNNIWNFEKELKEHCDQKLFLLTISCLKFIRDCLEFQNHLKVWNLSASEFLHPFSYPLCSIGGFVFKLFKILVLNKFDIYAINNEFGIGSKNVSKVEHEWASFMAYKFPENEFMSAFNNINGQKYFKEAIPDLYSPITKQAFFMHGCVFHGHFNNCLINPTASATTLNPFGKTYQELSDEFEAKSIALMDKNPNSISTVEICWECIYKQSRSSLEMQIFLKNHFKPHPLYRLKPRTCVRGAYFDVLRLFWTKDLFPNEKMYFVDVNGLYSFCAIKFKYMIGKCKILIGNDLTKLSLKSNKFYCNNERVMGAMLVTILPPQDLLLPFLPYRTANGKTVNTLCVTCAERQLRKCQHSAEERAITSSYMISEIEFALSLNYQIMHIHEAHLYFESDFILKDFIKAINFFKTKSSKIFQNCNSEEDKLKICKTLNLEMDLLAPFQLTPENNCPNDSKRTFYKLMANALFGKFEQKSNKTQTLFLNSQSDIEDIYFSENKIDDIFCLNEEICQIQVIPNELKLPPNRKTNCYLGAQITAYARQIIYEKVQKLIIANAIIYQIDCDSIIFTLPTNQSLPIKISEAVGHFKHEIKGDINTFYSLGPKNYSITFLSEKGTETLSRVRGFALNNSLNEIKLDENLFKFYVTQFLKQKSEHILLKQFRRKADFKKLKISSQIEEITFSNALSKRRNVNFTTAPFLSFPYGFK